MFNQRAAAIALWIVCCSAGCATSTAHRVPIEGNPLRAQAEACVQACRAKIRPAVECPPTMSETDASCVVAAASASEPGDYAACLDGCPGATAIDGTACPQPPAAGVICEETTKANPGGIAGGVVAAVAIVVAILLVTAMATAFGEILRPPQP